MTNAKLTRRALLSSVLALVLCFTMLLGTTFAWFTDEAVSSGNKIIAGNLDVELLLGDGAGTYSDISNSTATLLGGADSLVAQNNNADTLWEPGKTQVVYLAIKNNGNLALKYQVSLNVVNPEGGKNLYEVMQYTITPDAQSGITEWKSENAKGVVPGAQIVSDGVGHLVKGETHYFALSIHMDENAGNAYKDGQVIFDLTVLATQDTVESDSFGNQYDAKAWSDVAEPVIPDENGVAYVYTAQQLAGVAADLTNVKTIKLMEDIDFSGRTWIPAVWWAPENTAPLTIDGNGCTISNMVVNSQKNVGFIGQNSRNLTIKNLTFANADVTGTQFAGVVIGYMYGEVVFENVDVIDSEVAVLDTEAGKGIRAGGLVGFIPRDGKTLSLTDCDVTGSTISGYHNVGSMVGTTMNTDATVVNSTAKNNTLIYRSEKVGAFAFGAGDSGYNEYAPAGFTAENMTVCRSVSFASEINAALNAGKNVVLTDSVEAPLAKTAIYGTPVAIVQDKGGIIDGNGYSLNIENPQYNGYAIETYGGTIKNLTIDSTVGRGIIVSSPKEDTYIDNVVIDGPGYAINTTEHNAKKLVVTNSTINGWTSFAGLASASFTNCEFGENTSKYWQNSGYDQDYDRLIRPYVTTVFTDCEFEQDFYIDLSALGNDCTVTLTNCTVNGVVLTADNYSQYITIENYSADYVIFE